MKTAAAPILEEVWRIKDELAREAGHDPHRFCDNTPQWAAAYPPRERGRRNGAYWACEAVHAATRVATAGWLRNSPGLATRTPW